MILVRRRLGLYCLAAAALVILAARPATADQFPCVPATAVAEVVTSSIKFDATLSAKSQAAILKQAALIARLPSNSGKSVGSQLSPEESRIFEEIRRELVVIEATKKVFSDYVRDVRVIAQMMEFSQVMNRYEVTETSIAPNDRNRFFFYTLMALREIQLEPSPGDEPKADAECTIAKAIDLAEKFELIQLSKQPTSEKAISAVKDLRRIRNLSVLASKQLELQLRDYLTITWKGDSPVIEGSYDKWIATQPTSLRNIDSKIWSVIRTIVPSEKDYELTFRKRLASEASKEYPAVK